MKIVELITNNNIEFSTEEWLLRHKIDALSFLLFCTTIVLTLFVFIRYANGDYITAIADLVGVIAFIIMYKLVKRDKKYYNTISLICAIIITFIISIGAFVSEGSVERSIWFFSILIFVYFFRDSKEGKWWLFLLISIISFIHFKNPDSNTTTYLILIMNMFLMSLVLFFYEKIKFHENHYLTNLNETLEQKVAERTKELDQLNNSLEIKVQEEIAKNVLKDKIMVQQSKMAAMGEMIGNIAHQFRQPLSAITATTSVTKFEMEMDATNDEEIKKKFTNIEEYAEHLSETIEDFRNFFKEDKEKTTFNLSKSLSKDLFLVEPSYMANSIELIKILDNNIEITQFKNELTQSLLNIFNNAKDALLLNEIPNKLVFLETKQKENLIYISIKDNAGGIPVDVMPNIFEEKFSTKKETDGTGIGLYMTRQMIEDHMDGKIEAKNVKYIYNNEYYKGAELIITLPLN